MKHSTRAKPGPASHMTLFQRRSVLHLVLAGHRGLLWGGVLCSALNAASTLALIGTLQGMLDAAAIPSADWWLTLGLLVLALASHVVSGACLGRLGAQQIARMRRELAAAIAASDYELTERAGQARLYAAFAEDLPRLAVAFSVVPTMLLNSIVALCALGYLAVFSLTHTLVLLALLGCGLLISEAVLRPRLQQVTERLRAATTTLYQRIQGLAFGGKELQLNAQRAEFFRRELLEPSIAAIEAQSTRRELLAHGYNAWSAAVSLVLVVAILWVSSYWLPMDRTQKVAFVLILLFVRGPVVTIINNVPNLIGSGVALQTIRSLLHDIHASCAPRPADAPEDWPDPAAFQELVLEQMTFQYAQQRDVDAFALLPFSLTIKRGEVVFVTGGNGSGKSTFAKLLVGLYRPTAGSVRLEGHLVTERHVGWYRSHFTTIFSDFYLFEHVLSSAGVQIEDAELNRQLAAFALAHKVSAQQGRFSTLSLSQGQRKRLALIVAIAEQRPILLLDEWAADQDPEFRHAFYCEVIPALQRAGKTIIAITHDDRYFGHADRIVRFEEGRLTEVSLPAADMERDRLDRLRSLSVHGA